MDESRITETFFDKADVEALDYRGRQVCAMDMDAFVETVTALIAPLETRIAELEAGNERFKVLNEKEYRQQIDQKVQFDRLVKARNEVAAWFVERGEVISELRKEITRLTLALENSEKRVALLNEDDTMRMECIERLTAELADVKEMFSAAESEESRLREKCGVLTFELSEARKEILQLTNELGGLYVHRDMLLAQSEKPAPAVEEVKRRYYADSSEGTC